MPIIQRADALSHPPVSEPRPQVPSTGAFRNAFNGIHSSASALDGPYYSPKRDPMLSLNGAARVGDALLFCSGLSVLWERSFDCNAGKPDYRHFSSVERLQAHAPPDIEAQAAHRGRAEATFVDNADWGRWIADAFKSMEAAGRPRLAVQVRTQNHAMSLGLRIKTECGVPAYVVKIYDPNRTATHLRTRSDSPDAFVGLTALDFLLDREMLADYGMDAHSGSVVFLGDVIPDHGQQPVRIEHVDAATLLHLLSLGLAAGVARFGEMVRARALDARQVAELLAVRTEDGVPGLFMAMHRDDGDTIKAYADMLVRAALDSSRASGLLACRTRDGVPGLNSAMQADHAKAIQAWGDAFLRCRLDPADAVALLAAERADGTLGLSMAMYWNSDRAVLAYGRILLASGLPPTRLVELLEAKDRYGAPALYAAMVRGSARAIRAFGAILVASPLDSSQRTGLLAAADLDRTSALNAALRDNQVDAVRAYGKVLARSGLDRWQLSHLLGATDDTAAALAAALRGTGPATQLAYGNLLRMLAP